MRMNDRNSIAVGGDNSSVKDKEMQAFSIDARDMTKDLAQRNISKNSFGCNTIGVTTASTNV
jgi:hypothetical protein